MRTPPERPADGVVGLFYESFVPGEDCCELGLRALNVSRVKCGGLTLSLPLSATMYETYDMPTIRLYERIAEGLISTCRKHVVVATGSSPFKVRDNQRPERTMSGVENLRLSVPSPVKN